MTAAEGWVERAQAQWLPATARIQRCGLDIYTRKPESYWIDCSLGYTVDGEEIVAHVHSRSTPAPRRVIAQNPTEQFDLLQQWVEDHPEGTPIAGIGPLGPSNHIVE